MSMMIQVRFPRALQKWAEEQAAVINRRPQMGKPVTAADVLRGVLQAGMEPYCNMHNLTPPNEAPEGAQKE